MTILAVEVESKLINGEWKTRDEAVVENIKLAQKIAARFEAKAKTVGLEYSDLVSTGTIGLLKAYDDFNDQLGYRFSTYAVPKIMGEITRTIAQTHVGAHYPIDLRRYADIIQSRELEDRSLKEIAEILGTNEKRALHALEYLTQGMPASLDMNAPGTDDKELSSFGDLIGKDQDYSSVMVQEFLSLLTAKERNIVQHLLSGKTVVEIGKIYGNARAAISYYVELVQKKWVLYQYGIQVNKKKRELEKLVSEEELKIQFEWLRAGRLYRKTRR